jgi:hypothetical protein
MSTRKTLRILLSQCYLESFYSLWCGSYFGFKVHLCMICECFPFKFSNPRLVRGFFISPEGTVWRWKVVWQVHLWSSLIYLCGNCQSIYYSGSTGPSLSQNINKKRLNKFGNINNIVVYLWTQNKQRYDYQTKHKLIPYHFSGDVRNLLGPRLYVWLVYDWIR